MGELTIRRNRGFAVPRYQGAGKAEKQGAAGSSQKAARSTGLNISETLRQLMSRVSQVESHSRESRRTLQAGEIALDEVQDSLREMARLAERASGDGEVDRAALQKELERLVANVDRAVKSAAAGGTPLFLDGGDGGIAGELETLLSAVAGKPSAALPDWLMRGIAQSAFTPEQALYALGLDKNASGAEILSAIAAHPPESNAASAYLASLYLGAVIAGGDPDQALDGLRQLMEKVSAGVPPDQAIQELTDGAFTSLADLQEQSVGGTAPGMQEFLADLLLSDAGASLLTGASALTLLAGMEGVNLELMMGLLSALQSTETAAPENAGNMTEALPRPVAIQTENVQVVGADLSGVTVDEAAGRIVIAGTADVTVQGLGGETPEILVTGSGTVTLQNVTASTLTVASPEAQVRSAGESVLGELHLGEGTVLTLGGGGLLRLGAVHAHESNVLRLTGGAVIVEGKDGKTPGILTVPVIVEGPVSLAAHAANVRSPEGKVLEPFDIVWQTLLPGFSAITSMAADGRHAKMLLMGGDIPALARLWLEKGDPSSHGYPVCGLEIQGRDQSGRAKTRYTYLLWSQQSGGFQEAAMYPNPFTITGGQESRDWVYEEESHTLFVLSNQVTAIAGGAGTDANQSPFSGRIALADGIGATELTLGGVVCRVSSGRAFSLGQENDVTLYLQSGTSNIFESGAGCAGISLGDGTSLCIDESRGDDGQPAGTLTASGGEGGAGIGRDSGGSRDQTSRIRILGGVITASGTGGGAGIGAGKRGFMGPITITGGLITSAGEAGGGAGIGGALGAPAGDTTIRGGTVTASAISHAAAIGAGVQGASGDITIAGSARIAKAQGGDPGADIGACLFGRCGRVVIAGGADIGSARLLTRSGIPLQMGEDIVTLPQFRFSARALHLRKLSVETQERAREACVTIDADQRWTAQIQSAYSSLQSRLEQSCGGLSSVQQYIDAGPVRDSASVTTLLRDMRKTIPLPASQAISTHSKRGTEDVERLLR